MYTKSQKIVIRNEIQVFHTQFNNYSFIRFFLCLFITISFNIVTAQIPICTRTQACAAEISKFPLMSETVGQMIDLDGSGQSFDKGSGQEIEETFPFYDEFVSQTKIFDYGADAEIQQTQICRCPSSDDTEDENSNECSFVSEENIMNIDKTLRLTFCRPIPELFKTKCAGRRALIRIIGEVDAKTSETIASVNDTAVFCRCDESSNGSSGTFRRVNIEPWFDKYAFNYRCVWSLPNN